MGMTKENGSGNTGTKNIKSTACLEFQVGNNKKAVHKVTKVAGIINNYQNFRSRTQLLQNKSMRATIAIRHNPGGKQNNVAVSCKNVMIGCLKTQDIANQK